MRQATSQETVSDPGHSLILESSESNGNGSLKSAAMLGIALSVGASGALIPSAEAAAITSPPTASATTEAFSSDTQVATAPDATAVGQIVGYHTVASGESLWQIAQQHRVGLQDLKAANAFSPETSISVGQVLKVPAAGTALNATNGGVVRELAQADPVQIASAEINTVVGAVRPLGTDRSERDSEIAGLLPAASEKRQNAVSEMTVSEMTVTPTSTVDLADASVAIASADSVESAEAAATVVTAYAPTPATSSYRVQSGDTLRSIASSLGTTPEAIVRANSLIDPDVIFVGSTLVVPAAPAANPAKWASVAEEIRTAGPEEALSVGGEKLTEQALLGSVSNRGSRDPYVANLLAEVQEIRDQSVEVSEADSVELEADAAVSAESPLIASADASDRISRLNVAGRTTPRTEAENSRISPQTTASQSATSQSAASQLQANSDLLAAAPLSPDAYIPAQRSTGQVVSPDMPILPSADEYLPDAPDYFDGFMWPTQGTITSGFGWRWGRMHSGVDVAGPVGTPVVAAAAGVVEQAGWNSGGYGNLVEVRHPDGSLTRYAHNNSLNVSAGQHVQQGQQIAAMGSTGYSTGPHLHFEVHQGGAAVNPVAYLPSR